MCLVLTVGGGALERELDQRIQIFHLRSKTASDATSLGRINGIQRFLHVLWRECVGRPQQFFRSRRIRSQVFDVAIAGTHGLDLGFIANFVRADKYVVMVRSDPAWDGAGKFKRNLTRFPGLVDLYVCVAKSVRASLLQLYPELERKTYCVYNLINTVRMRRLSGAADESIPDKRDTLIVLTVCRLQEVSKGLLRMVEAHRRLLDGGLAHEWHVLGDGPDRRLLETAIAANGVKDSFILHGSVANPFPWYKHADICAVLSRYEGLCGVVNEARVLERPVIATRFSGIEEQIEDGVNGLIVEQDVDAICAGLSRLMQDPSLRERLAKGGYPDVLLDDDAKIDALINLFAASPRQC